MPVPYNVLHYTVDSQDRIINLADPKKSLAAFRGRELFVYVTSYDDGSFRQLDRRTKSV